MLTSTTAYRKYCRKTAGGPQLPPLPPVFSAIVRLQVRVADGWFSNLFYSSDSDHRLLGCRCNNPSGQVKRNLRAQAEMRAKKKVLLVRAPGRGGEILRLFSHHYGCNDVWCPGSLSIYEFACSRHAASEWRYPKLMNIVLTFALRSSHMSWTAYSSGSPVLRDSSSWTNLQLEKGLAGSLLPRSASFWVYMRTIGSTSRVCSSPSWRSPWSVSRK